MLPCIQDYLSFALAHPNPLPAAPKHQTTMMTTRFGRRRRTTKAVASAPPAARQGSAPVPRVPGFLGSGYELPVTRSFGSFAARRPWCRPPQPASRPSWRWRTVCPDRSWASGAPRATSCGSGLRRTSSTPLQICRFLGASLGCL